MMMMERIMREVCRIGGVRRNELLSSRRSGRIVHARQVAAWLAHRHTSLSAVRIGQLLHRDHTVILHAVRKIERLRSTPPEALTEAQRRLLALAQDCEAALMRRLNDELHAALAEMRRRAAVMQAQWRKEHAHQRQAGRAAIRARALASLSWRPARVPMSGGMRVHVPAGRTLTGVLMGDPAPGRSALDRRMAS